MPPGDGLPRPLPRNPKPVHPLPGDPLRCPLCKKLRFPSVYARDLHYLQNHLIEAPTERCAPSLKRDCNHDGILGKEKHVFEPEHLCLEPNSYTGERVPRENYGKLVKKEKLVTRIWRKLGQSLKV